MTETLLGSPYSQDLSAKTFANTYGDNPWAGIETNKRLVYDPYLRDVYRDMAVFAGYINYTQNLGSINAKEMEITGLFDIHANFDQIGLRDMWKTAEHVDSRSQRITFGRYGGKVAYHKYDPMVTYWKTQGGGSSMNAIRAILSNKLGQHMIQVQDMLARNAFLGAPFQYFANDKTSFGTLSPEDKIQTNLLDEIHLGMKNRRVPYAVRSDGSVGNIVCITTPSVIFDLRRQTDPKDWIYPNAYASPQRLLNYEVGTFHNVRFVESKQLLLQNCGTIAVQATVTTAISAGDGSPDPTSTLVDSTYKTGQSAARHYIQLDAATSAASMAKFAINQEVTVHTQRTSSFGVTGGVDYRDGTAETRRIVSVDATNKRLSFSEPIMLDFSTDLGSGVYAYVTRGVNVNPLIFLGGSDGIVMGMSQPPRMYAPPPVDDFDSMYRFSWDSYQGYTLFNPSVIEVAFAGGSYRAHGTMDSQV